MNTQEEFRDRNYLNPEITNMFHALGLIESYGSGIRRAKHAMADNGNPPLLFEPLNDTDDYTMVTCPINEEFAFIRDHEDEATRGTSESTTQKRIEIAQEQADTTKETTQEQADTTKETTQEQADTTKEHIQMATHVANGTRENIVLLLSESPSLTAEQLGKRLGISPDGVRYHLKALRKDGVIRHEGSTKAGYWLVLKKESNDG